MEFANGGGGKRKRNEKMYGSMEKCRRGGIGIGHAGICRKNLADAVNILNGNGEYFDTPYNIEEMQTGRILDFADVSGQVLVKRACETAVSGMHNLLFVGPPGAGKTMIAERIPGILPSLNTKERMELLRYTVSAGF